MSPSLSLAIMTLNGSWRLERAIHSALHTVDEVVVLVDSATTDDTRERARRLADVVAEVHNPEGYIEPHIQHLLDLCSGDWVLRIDDDEILGASFSLERVLETDDHLDLVGLPWPWVVSTDPVHLIGTGRGSHEVLPQYRLLRRAAARTFDPRIHTPGVAMDAYGETTDDYLYHLVLLDRTAPERHDKYDRYERRRSAPWNRNYLIDPATALASGNTWSLPQQPRSPTTVCCYDVMTMDTPQLCKPDVSVPYDLMRATAEDFPL